jgi:hypothetical protein
MSCKPRKLILLLMVLVAWGSHAYASAIGSLTVSGNEQQSSTGTWDTGVVTATINGQSVSFHYGQFSSPEAIASAMGALISQNCNMPVYAKASGAVLSFYKKGTNTINSITISSSSDNSTIFPSPSFQVNGAGGLLPPEITGLSLSEGPSSVGIIITGNNFGYTGTVTIGGVPATVVPGTWTPNSITVQVPTGIAAYTVADVVVTTWVMNVGQSFTFTVDPPFGCN